MKRLNLQNTPTRFYKFRKSFTIGLLAALFSVFTGHAQLVTIGTGLGTSNYYPIYSYYGYNYSQSIYLAGEINAAGGTGPAYINSIKYFYTTASNPIDKWNNWTVYLKNTPTALFADNASWETGLTQVFSGQIMVPPAGQWLTINFDTPFLWDGVSNIVVGIDENIPGYSSSAAGWKSTTIGSPSNYRTLLYYNDGNNPDPLSPPLANYFDNSFPDIQFNMYPNINCSGTPNAGVATAGTSSVCVNQPIALSLSGVNNGVGLEYQWQSSPDGTTWSNLGSTQINWPYTNTIGQTAATYYRCITTCTASSQTATSTPVTVYQNQTINCICKPSYIDCSNNYFTNVSFSNLNETPACNAGNNGYEDYTASAPTVSVAAGQSYPISVSVNGSSSSVINAWIDYDQNGKFESHEQINIGGGSFGGTFTNTLTLSVNALGGNTRMRLILEGYNSYKDACSPNNSYGGQVLDYLLNVTPAPLCSGVPNGGTAKTNQSFVCQSSTYNLYLVGTNIATGLTYQWQSSPNGTGWSDLGLTQLDHAYTISNQTATTYYRCITTCTASSQTATSTPVIVYQNQAINCVCKPSYLDCSNNYFTNVSFSNLNETPVCNAGSNGYEDYTASAPTGSVAAGQSYSVSLSVNGLSSSVLNAWIDYNQNGNFESNEQTYIGGGSFGGIFTNTLTLPVNALGGNTRMRLILESNNSYNNACYTNYTGGGQVLDYLLNVTPAPVCSGLPNAGTAVTSESLVCKSTTYALNLNGSSIATGFSYQWQNSADGASWSNFGSPQNTIALSVSSQTAATYYRCVLTCTANSLAATSNSVLVNQDVFYKCMCKPSYLDCSYDSFSSVSFSNLNETNIYCYTGGYEDHTSSMPTVSVTAGQSYSIDINVNSSGRPYGLLGAWIDENQSGDFETGEYRLLSNNVTTSGSYTATIAVPFTALGGDTRMRLKFESLYSPLTNLDPCSSTGYYGQALDYLLNVTPAPLCSGTPNAGIAVSTATAVCENKLYTLDLNGSSAVSGISYQWQSSSDGSVWTNYNAAQNTIPLSVASQSATTYYQCIATCTPSGLSATSVSVAVIQNLPTDCYCVPDMLNCGSSSISDVVFETLTDNPTCSSAINGYLYNSASVASVTLTAGQTYTISTNISSLYGDNYVGAWVDYNQNGLFESASEYTSFGTVPSPGGTVTGTIVIPFTAFGGNTRIRIKLETNYQSVILNPCSASSNDGQVLDYLVNMVPAPACSGTPNAGNVISSDANTCKNQSFTLDLANNDPVSQIKYQWQSSVDNVSWLNMGVPQLTVPYTVMNQTVTTYYRSVLTCSASALSNTSTAIAITQNPLTDCYCTPPVTDCASESEINGVTFSTISFTSGCSGVTGYTNNAVAVPAATITAGSTNTITVSLGGSMYVAAWIDYNRNGEFDPSEFIDLGYATNNSVSVPITTPISALPGNTRMRIRAIYGRTIDATNACTNPINTQLPGKLAQSESFGKVTGETEDYPLTIVSADCSTYSFPAVISASTSLNTICAGSQVVLDTATTLPLLTGITYQWKSSVDGTNYTNIGTAATNSSLAITPTQTNYYICDVLCHSNLGVSSASVLVTVNTPTITISASAASICAGETTTLTANGASTYTWSNAATSQSISVTPALTSTYAVNAIDANACSGSATVNIVVNPIPVVSASASSFTICQGNTVSLSGAGSGVVSYSWIPGGSTLQSIVVTPTLSTTYTVIGTDANNCRNGDQLTVTVNQSSLTVVPATAYTVCPGQTTTLTATGAVSYTWNSGVNTPTTVVTPTINTTYTVVATDVNACTFTSTLTLQTFVATGISGAVTVSLDPTPFVGRVVLYQYEPFFTKFDSVAGQTINSTVNYNFPLVNFGTYIIKAVPTPTNTLQQITYGLNALTWKDATQIIHDCTNPDVMNISVQKLPNLPPGGPGTLSGKITEGFGYGQRPVGPLAPGNPIGNIIVKGGKNPGGNMLVQTTTAADGTYTLSNLPYNNAGESYFVMVDIPGLDTNNTYHRVITLVNDDYTNLDFTVDSVKINPIMQNTVTTNVTAINAMEHQVKVFPNPAQHYVTIQYHLKSPALVHIELYDVLGKHIESILPLVQQGNNSYQYTMRTEALQAGMYFIKLKINESESTIKLFINH